MTALRHHLRRHRALTALLLAAALALRLFVPAGFMPERTTGGPVLALCDGFGPITIGPAAARHHGSHGTDHDRSGRSHEGMAGAPCAFAGLSMPTLGGGDPIQPMPRRVVQIETGRLVFLALLPHAGLRLRPPLRGPPLSPDRSP